MNKDNDLPLREFKNFVDGPSNKNLFVLKENGKEYRAINDNNKSCLELQIDKGIIDNEEIILNDLVFYDDEINKRFYRISGPSKIPIKNAVINDNRVRLRVKPNLTCETWAFLDKGLHVKIKDKSKKKVEIDGEKWYWYKVDNPEYPDGWVYGKYLDIEK